MDYILTDEHRVLAVDPSTRGLGFAILEGPNQLIDWGVKQAEGDKNGECLRMVKELIDQYRPHVLVLENVSGKDSRRRTRVRELLQAIRETARQLGVKVMAETPERVRAAFTPKKDTIAAALAGRFPELASRLPKPRTLTMPEHSAMPVFDATAFAMTFFHFRNRKRLGEERKAIRAAFR
jgi:hypothetical protein